MRNGCIAMVAVLLVAAALRLVAFGQVPPGLYHDEAYNGLDAMEVLRGRLSLYFAANNGREPLFIYLIALSVGLLGKSPFALRLVACFAGLLTVAATGAMGRALFSRRVGLLAMAVLAVTLWHVHLSRVGFRAVLLPLLTALAIWQGALGVAEIQNPRSRVQNPVVRRRHWLAAGIFYGLSFYTYTAARFTPVALAAFALYLLIVRPPTSNLQSTLHNPTLWRGVGLAALATLSVITPLGAYTLAHPDVVLGRPEQVSVFSPAIHGGDVWGTLGEHTLRTLGMFFVRGDRIWRHNVPWRPVFDPLLGGAFALGLLVALRRARRDAAAGFVLIWTVVMSLPTLLAEDTPHFLRAVGVLPVVVLLPALGMAEIQDRTRITIHVSRFTFHVSRFALVLPVLFGLASTSWAYFGDYAGDPVTGYWFEDGAVTLAGRINGFLGTGWDGERMVQETRGQGDKGTRRRGGGVGADGGNECVPGDECVPHIRATSTGTRVYLDPVLWEQWPQVRFLVAAPEAMTVGLATPISSLQPPTSSPQVAVFAWPYGDWQRAWPLLPAPAEVTVEEGPLSQGDRDPAPYTTYLAFFATAPDPAMPALARFSAGVELLGVEVTPMNEGGLRVRLRWRATAPLADYTVFLHYIRDGERLAQADSRPAGGHYPTTVWRPGDVVNDDHYPMRHVQVHLSDALWPGHDTLRFGFWQPESGEVLYLLDEAGNPAGDWIEVAVDAD